MKKSYYIWTGVVAVAIVALLLVPAYLNRQRENVMGVEEANTPEELVEAYVRANISALSPEKEVLGGKFYVTVFSAKDGSGTVLYEDGHNAFGADFTYTVSSDGVVTINSFVVTSMPGANTPPPGADILK